MFEELHQSRLLKDVPAVLLRTLPSIYYYSRFVETDAPERVTAIFQANIRFLESALHKIGQELEMDRFTALSSYVGQMQEIQHDELLAALDHIILDLSMHCTSNLAAVQQLVRDQKQSLTDLYNKLVPSLHIVICDVNDEPGHVEKLSAALIKSCNYSVEACDQCSSEYANKIVQSDIVVFASTHPGTIHQEMQNMESYHKPTIGLARSEVNGNVDESSIRHAAQLIRMGFEILFKPFNPTKLYTSIERTFMKYHLQSGQRMVA